MSRLPDTDFDSLLPPLILDRRGFMATTLAGGFALAAGPAAATAIATDDKGLVAGQIQIPVEGGRIPAYRAAPDGNAAAPVILVVQEIFGVHEYIKDVCRRLAKVGYMAIAPELYSRQGDPSKYTEVAQLISQVVNKVPDPQVMSDLDAAVAWAGKNGGDVGKLGITGFCWGGRIVWLYAAHNPEVDAGVAWYGRLVGNADALHPSQPVDVAAKLHGPILGLYGGKDAGITQDSIDAMKAELAKGPDAARQSEFVIYPDAPHAFHADYRPSYRPDAAQDGWKRALAWFDKHLGG
ncbi:dienelactone hydrolase family protein [Pollutimonas sp. H1-120]|uniref:dienelactone hydrolase family protein n=1 Tax=Pollutimonas sp. H1-120 TaxID=3148824 RepID=UPI003B522873